MEQEFNFESIKNTEAIGSVYPNAIVQLRVVHQIRNSIKHMGSKHQKEFLLDLKRVYQAVNKESAAAAAAEEEEEEEEELVKLGDKWGV